MRYVLAKIEQEDRDYAYRIFVTESLRLQGEEKYLTIKYSELFTNDLFIKISEPDKDGEEVIQTVMNDLGLKFGGE